MYKSKLFPINFLPEDSELRRAVCFAVAIIAKVVTISTADNNLIFDLFKEYDYINQYPVLEKSSRKLQHSLVELEKMGI